MARIKLVKGRSYAAGQIKATREKSFVDCDDATAKEAVATGFFVLADGQEKTKPETPKEPEAEGKPLEKMNKSELETFATYNDVDIKAAKSKADIIEILKEALPEEELTGNIVYGSPTITELEKEQ